MLVFFFVMNIDFVTVLRFFRKVTMRVAKKLKLSRKKNFLAIFDINEDFLYFANSLQYKITFQN